MAAHSIECADPPGKTFLIGSQVKTHRGADDAAGEQGRSIRWCVFRGFLKTSGVEVMHSLDDLLVSVHDEGSMA
jgi:hypothetical protein